jgi:hypothetical protein
MFSSDKLEPTSKEVEGSRFACVGDLYGGGADLTRYLSKAL